MSEKQINDSEWHNVIFKRDGSYGELIVDDDEPESGYSLGPASKINVNPPFFVGGVLPEIHNIVYENIVRPPVFFYKNCLELRRI